MTVAENLPPLPIRRLARVLAVMAIAMAAGHLVQTLADRKPVAMAQAATSISQHVPMAIVQLSAGNAPKPTYIAPAPVVPVLAASTELAPEPVATLVPMAAPIAAKTCPLDLALDAQPAAMIGIVVLAPCHADERIVLRHAGLAVTAKLGADGTLAMAMPALLSDALVEVMFADGNTIDGQLDLPEAANLRRFGVQWQGSEAFVVHGLQNGADYSQPGDISPTNPGRPGDGLLTVLGDGTVEVPLLAQVYTFPSAPGVDGEVVIEALVTKGTCGHDLIAETIASGAGRVEITDLTLAMPDCSGVGDFLVLKNLGADMKIAAN